MTTLPRVVPVGDAAILIELGLDVDPAVNDRVLALDAKIGALDLEGVVEIVPTYRSLLVHFDQELVDGEQLLTQLQDLDLEHPGAAPDGRHWTVPVVYGGAHGVDLEEVAARHGMTPDEVVAIHTASAYRCYMIGFAPGFTYLGGLDPRLHTPRRDNPRLRTPAGSVSIGGIQTGVASIEAPSGWNLLGQTPVRPFHPRRDPAILFEAGDTIRFRPVPAADFAELAARAAAGDPLIEPEPPPRG